MDNLITETNVRLQEIIDNLTTIKEEYEGKLNANNKEIEDQLDKVKKYKEEFFVSKQKIEKMNSDIEGFEEDYKKLVERFKDDELANILIAANKEISTKIDERRKKITKDKIAMNELVEHAEECKNKLVKLTAEKKALELCLAKILDSHEFYSKSLSQVINYSNEHREDLSSCFYEEGTFTSQKPEQIDRNHFVDTTTETEDVLYEEDDDQIDFDEDAFVEEANEIDKTTLLTPEAIDEIGLEDYIDDEEIASDDEFEYSDIDEEGLSEDLNIDLNSDDKYDYEIDINVDDDKEDVSTSFDEDIELDIEEDMLDDDSEEIKIEEDSLDNDEIEDTNHTMVIDDIPSSLYDLNDSLDLESFLGLDDELQDDDSLYEE